MITPKLSPTLQNQKVKKRLIFYIPGFDPMPPNRYREGFRYAAQKQSEISGYNVTIDRLPSQDHHARFSIHGHFDEGKVESEYRFLSWSDLVKKELERPIWQAWLDIFRVGKVIAGSGALWRLINLKYQPNLAGLYPYAVIFLQLISSLLIGYFSASVLAMGSFSIFAILFTSIFFGLMVFWYKIDHKIMAYYLLIALGFICKEKGQTPHALKLRIEEFQNEIAHATSEGFDEILIVAHSSGAHIAVMVLAGLISQNRARAEDKIALLTLGETIPLVAYLPQAQDLRGALDIMGAQKIIPWVDFTSLADGCCFATIDPVKASITPTKPTIWPKIYSAAFTQTVDKTRLKYMRWHFFRIHFQYLSYFEKPNIYDYIAITSGPVSLKDRFADIPQSPTKSEKNTNKYAQDF